MSKTLSSLVVSSIATTTVPGGVKVDGSTITISNGVISSNVPTASTTTLGGVKVDGTSVTITNGVITSSPRLTFSSTGASYIPLNTSVVKWYAYENDLLPISTPVDGTSARTISYNNVGASPVGGSLNLTTVGDLAKSASFIVTNTNTLGTVATNNVDLSEIRGVTGTNTIKNNTFTVRKSNGNDWTTAALHNSIGIDNLYLTPGTDTKCFWERNPYNETHTFGSSGNTYLTLSSSGAVINGSLAAGVAITNITAAYTVVASDIGKIINCTTGTFTVSLTAAATLGAGFAVTIWNTSSTVANSITISPASGTIDGVASLILHNGEGTQIICDGTNWQTGNQKELRGYAENIGQSNTRPVVSGYGSIAIGAYTNSTSEGTVAIGGNTVQGSGASATGLAAIAIGARSGGANASGSHAIAIGAASSLDTVASASNSVAIGSNSGSTGSQAVTGAGAMALGGSYASGTDSFAAAVANNTSTYGATGSNSVAIGYQAKASGNAGSIAIGYGSIVSGNGGASIGYQNNAAGGGNGCFIFGNQSQSTGTNSFSIGTFCLSSNANAFATGYYSNANVNGKYSYAGGTFGTAGDAQLGNVILRAATTTNSAVILTSDGGAASATNQITLPNQSAYSFSALVVARQSSSQGTASAAWKFEGLVRREATASTTVLVSSNMTVLSNAPSWTVALSADTTNGCLTFTVTGAAATNIRWVATVTTSEVIYP